MGQDAVFGKDVNKEKLGELRCGDVNIARDQDDLFRRLVNNNQNSVKLTGLWKLFNKVHGNRMPRPERNREWFKQTVRSMSRCLIAPAGDTRLAVVPDERPELRPSVLASNES